MPFQPAPDQSPKVAEYVDKCLSTNVRPTVLGLREYLGNKGSPNRLTTLLRAELSKRDPAIIPTSAKSFEAKLSRIIAEKDQEISQLRAELDAKSAAPQPVQVSVSEKELKRQIRSLSDDKYDLKNSLKQLQEKFDDLQKKWDGEAQRRDGWDWHTAQAWRIVWLVKRQNELLRQGIDKPLRELDAERKAAEAAHRGKAWDLRDSYIDQIPDHFLNVDELPKTKSKRIPTAPILKPIAELE